MKLNAFINQKPEAVYTFLLATIIVTLPYSHFLSSLGTILLGVYWLVSGNFSDKMSLLKHNMPALALLALFAVHVFSLAYSDNFLAGWHQVEKRLSLLVFPLVLGSITLSSQKQAWLQKVYVGSASASVLWGLTLLYMHYQDTLLAGRTFNLAYYQWRMPHLFSFQAPKWAMFVGGAVFCTLILFKRSQSWLYLLLFVLLNAFLIFLASRTALFGLWLIIGLYFIVLALTKKKLSYAMLVLVLMIFVGSMALYTSPYLKGKLTRFNGFSERNILWVVGFEVWKENPLMGIGAGSQVRLEEAIEAKDSKVMTTVGNDVHNQYLSVLVYTGLLGFTCLLAGFIITLYYGWRFDNHLSIMVASFFYFTFLTESLLANQQGVVTFAMFYSLLACIPLNNVIKNKYSNCS